MNIADKSVLDTSIAFQWDVVDQIINLRTVILRVNIKNSRKHALTKNI